MSWGDTFKPILNKLGYDIGYVDFTSLINFADVINSRIDINTMNPIILLNEVSLFGSKSSIYKTLFNSDNYQYLANDPSPNSSSLDKESRLKTALNLYKEMYRREKINIPAMDEFMDINNKKVHIVMGDVTNPLNLTLGERTGSCMRIGGAGDTLLKNSLVKNNGFSIRFEDAKTGELITRVNGFRNGNTVFLNELRYSKVKQYSNLELVDLCKRCARNMIKSTSHDVKPIDNVVIYEAYATETLKNDVVFFNVDNIKEGLDPFYTDIFNAGIVLASTNGTELVPIKLYTDMPEYDVGRQKMMKSLNDIKACNAVNKSLLTEAILNDKKLTDVDLVEDAVLTLSGEDWYVYINNNQEIYGHIFLGISDERYKRAEKEYEQAYNLLSPFIKNSEELSGGKII